MAGVATSVYGSLVAAGRAFRGASGGAFYKFSCASFGEFGVLNVLEGADLVVAGRSDLRGEVKYSIGVNWVGWLCLLERVGEGGGSKMPSPRRRASCE